MSEPKPSRSPTPLEAAPAPARPTPDFARYAPQEFVPVAANDALRYRVMARAGEEWTEVASFSPAALGLFFGEDELIPGYKGLRAEVWLTPRLAQAYLKVSFERSANPELLPMVMRQLYRGAAADLQAPSSLLFSEAAFL